MKFGLFLLLWTPIMSNAHMDHIQWGHFLSLFREDSVFSIVSILSASLGIFCHHQSCYTCDDYFIYGHNGLCHNQPWVGVPPIRFFHNNNVWPQWSKPGPLEFLNGSGSSSSVWCIAYTPIILCMCHLVFFARNCMLLLLATATAYWSNISMYYTIGLGASRFGFFFGFFVCELCC